MTSNWEQSKSGLFTPAEILSSQDGLPIPSADAPVFRFLLGNLTTEWSMKNWETVWNSPIYDDVSNVWSVTMEGIDILKAEGFANTSKGIVVSQMMARGLSLARTACWAMAVGSPMDALACYRMIYDRALTLQFLDQNDQYQEFDALPEHQRAGADQQEPFRREVAGEPARKRPNASGDAHNQQDAIVHTPLAVVAYRAADCRKGRYEDVRPPRYRSGHPD